MDRHCANAAAVASYLEQNPRVARVLYPGLPSHPGHAIAARQMRNFGGMVSFLLEDEQEAVDLVARTKIWKLAESLGGVESLIEHPARMTHASTADAPFAVPPTLIRLSVGIESAEDLIDDLESALAGRDARADRPAPRGAGNRRAATSSRPTTARRSSTAARRLTSPHLKEGLASRGLDAHGRPAPAALAHPPRPRRGGRRARARAPRAPGARVRGRRAAPRRSVEAGRERAAPLRRRLRRALGRARADSRRENVHVVGERVVGLRLLPDARSRLASRVVPRRRTARSTPVTRPASGSRERSFVMPPCPPPELDLEAWDAHDHGRSSGARRHASRSSTSA